MHLQVIEFLTMEMESYISLGWTIILLALFAQRYILSQSFDPFSHQKNSIYKKDLKNQDKPFIWTKRLLENHYWVKKNSENCKPSFHFSRAPTKAIPHPPDIGLTNMHPPYLTLPATYNADNVGMNE